MINETLQFIATRLNEGLKTTGDNKVLVSSPTLADGTVPAGNTDKVLLTLINLDRSAAKAPISFGYKAATEQPAAADKKTGSYTLYVLLNTCFNSYSEALQYLDSSITILAANEKLDSASGIALPAGVSKMEVTLEQADGLQMRSIWLALGARFQPSVIYKVSVTMAVNEPDAQPAGA